MKRTIHYNQTIPKYETGSDGNINPLKITGEEKIYLSVESYNDRDFSEQLETVKGYCSDWTVEAEAESAIQETKAWVDKTLGKGMPYEDGKTYTVTREKQQLLIGQILIGSVLKESGTAADKIYLRWNASGEECTDWLYGDLCKLSYTISQYVEPIVAKQQKAETAIRKAGSDGEILEILKEFE